ncbi:WYL domain-containing transcriptional regulator [Myxococcota bacterium]|nr:WYL domain-containing transcriptional regulator [Myxococcota bacterium]
MKESSQLERQWKIMRKLAARRQGLSVKGLSDEFEVDKKTIARDLDTLSLAGFPVVREVEERGKQIFSLPTDFDTLLKTEITTLEALALYAARSHLVPLVGTPLGEDLNSLLDGIRERLDDNKINPPTVEKTFFTHPRGYKDYSEHGETIDDLTDAILRRRVCEIKYQRVWSDEVKTHILKPLNFFFHDGGLYLFCLLTENDYEAILAVERILEIDRTHEEFSIPPDVDIMNKLGHAFGVSSSGEAQDIEIIFSEDIAPFIEERVWHPDQKLKTLPDGRLRFTATLTGRTEIIEWVLGHAGDAELLKPKAWRDEIKKKLVRAIGAYGE